MFRLALLLLAFITATPASQDCQFCTTAKNSMIIGSWIVPNLNYGYVYGIPSNSIFFDESACALQPWLVNSTINCSTMCYKWQYSYTNPSTQHTENAVIRGCAGNLYTGQIPGKEGCQVGPIAGNSALPQGNYDECFCAGDCDKEPVTTTPVTTTPATTTPATTTSVTTTPVTTTTPASDVDKLATKTSALSFGTLIFIAFLINLFG